MMKAIATVGPMAISVDAGKWHDYESGIFSGGNKTDPELDHLVQLVGYGTDPESGGDYWLVRNSWTPLWGEAGYIRLARSANPQCGACTRVHDQSQLQMWPRSFVSHLLIPTISLQPHHVRG